MAESAYVDVNDVPTIMKAETAYKHKYRNGTCSGTVLVDGKTQPCNCAVIPILRDGTYYWAGTHKDGCTHAATHYKTLPNWEELGKTIIEMITIWCSACHVRIPELDSPESGNEDDETNINETLHDLEDNYSEKTKFQNRLPQYATDLIRNLRKRDLFEEILGSYIHDVLIDDRSYPYVKLSNYQGKHIFLFYADSIEEKEEHIEPNQDYINQITFRAVFNPNKIGIKRDMHKPDLYIRLILPPYTKNDPNNSDDLEARNDMLQSSVRNQLRNHNSPYYRSLPFYVLGDAQFEFCDEHPMDHMLVIHVVKRAQFCLFKE